jgi:hypothetical protein
MIAHIARYLSLHAAVVAARSCRMLRLALPSALEPTECRAAPSLSDTFLYARVSCESQFASMVGWMRVYAFWLVVHCDDISKLPRLLATVPNARWVRLDFAELHTTDHYEDVWRVVQLLAELHPSASWAKLANEQSSAVDAIVNKIHAFTGHPRYFRSCLLCVGPMRCAEHSRDDGDDWDSEDEEYDRMSRLNKIVRFRKMVSRVCAADSSRVHIPDIPEWYRRNVL